MSTHADASRNGMIARDVAECVREGRSPVVISERRDHLDLLEGLLRVGILLGYMALVSKVKHCETSSTRFRERSRASSLQLAPILERALTTRV